MSGSQYKNVTKEVKLDPDAEIVILVNLIVDPDAEKHSLLLITAHWLRLLKKN